MTQTMQDEFEADYCAHAHRLPALVKNCRLSNGSYGDPCIAKAWHWFKRSREMLVVDLPEEQCLEPGVFAFDATDVRGALHAAGITIAGESN